MKYFFNIPNAKTIAQLYQNIKNWSFRLFFVLHDIGVLYMIFSTKVIIHALGKNHRFFLNVAHFERKIGTFW